jgi:WD40 repeat protein
MAADPIVIPNCRLVPVEKQEVPSQRDGILLVVGTDIKPGERVPPDRLVRVKINGQDREFRRLKEGDAVEAGQLLALLDDRLVRDEWAIRKGQVAMTEADLAAAERVRDEARDRYVTQLKLQSGTAGPATSEEDVGGAKLLWYKNHYDAVAKREALALARLELHRAETLLGMHEMRSGIAGVIKKIWHEPGEAVRALEPVLEIRNFRRLRVEGVVGVEHLPQLQVGTRATIQPQIIRGPLKTLSGHLQEVTAVAVGREGNGWVPVSGSEDGTVRIWDLESGRQRRVLPHPAPVRAIACASGSCQFLVGTADGGAWLWDLTQNQGRPKELHGQHQGAVTAVALSADGRLAAAGGDDHSICLWDTTSGHLRYRFPAGHVGAVTSLQFLPSTKLLSAGRDNTLRLWSVGELAAVLEATREGRTGDVTRLGVSADGRQVLFDQGNTLHILPLAGAETLGQLKTAPGVSGFTGFALFSPDGRSVVTAGLTEGRLQLWRAPRDGAPACELWQLVPPDRGAATSAAFAPDGSFLVTGTRDRQVLIWALPEPDEVDRESTAEVTLVEQAAESDGHQVRVWAELTNAQGRLIPGTPVIMSLTPSGATGEK